MARFASCKGLKAMQIQKWPKDAADMVILERLVSSLQDLSCVAPPPCYHASLLGEKMSSSLTRLEIIYKSDSQKNRKTILANWIPKWSNLRQARVGAYHSSVIEALASSCPRLETLELDFRSIKIETPRNTRHLATIPALRRMTNLQALILCEYTKELEFVFAIDRTNERYQRGLAKFKSFLPAPLQSFERIFVRSSFFSDQIKTKLPLAQFESLFKAQLPAEMIAEPNEVLEYLLALLTAPRDSDFEVPTELDTAKRLKSPKATRPHAKRCFEHIQRILHQAKINLLLFHTKVPSFSPLTEKGSESCWTGNCLHLAMAGGDNNALTLLLSWIDWEYAKYEDFLNSVGYTPLHYGYKITAGNYNSTSEQPLLSIVSSIKHVSRGFDTHSITELCKRITPAVLAIRHPDGSSLLYHILHYGSQLCPLPNLSELFDRILQAEALAYQCVVNELTLEQLGLSGIGPGSQDDILSRFIALSHHSKQQYLTNLLIKEASPEELSAALQILVELSAKYPEKILSIVDEFLALGANINFVSKIYAHPVLEIVRSLPCALELIKRGADLALAPSLWLHWDGKDVGSAAKLLELYLSRRDISSSLLFGGKIFQALSEKFETATTISDHQKGLLRQFSDGLFRQLNVHTNSNLSALGSSSLEKLQLILASPFDLDPLTHEQRYHLVCQLLKDERVVPTSDALRLAVLNYVHYRNLDPSVGEMIIKFCASSSDPHLGSINTLRALFRTENWGLVTPDMLFYLMRSYKPCQWEFSENPLVTTAALYAMTSEIFQGANLDKYATLFTSVLSELVLRDLDPIKLSSLFQYVYTSPSKASPSRFTQHRYEEHGGATVLHLAVRSELAEDAFVDETSRKELSTALLVLRSYNADVTITDDDGQTPLQLYHKICAVKNVKPAEDIIAALSRLQYKPESDSALPPAKRMKL